MWTTPLQMQNRQQIDPWQQIIGQKNRLSGNNRLIDKSVTIEIKKIGAVIRRQRTLYFQH